jgi:hypothetical protein
MQASARIGHELTSGAPCRARTLRCTITAALLPPRPAVAPFVRPGNAALSLPCQAHASSTVLCNSATFAAAAAFPQSDDGSPASRGAFKKIFFRLCLFLLFLTTCHQIFHSLNIIVI